MPKMGESIMEATILRWNVMTGADQEKHAKRDEQPLRKGKCDKAPEHD